MCRLKTLVYKINGAKYIKVYIKHNWELNPCIIPKLIGYRRQIAGKFSQNSVIVGHPCCCQARHWGAEYVKNVAQGGQPCHKWLRGYKLVSILYKMCDKYTCRL